VEFQSCAGAFSGASFADQQGLQISCPLRLVQVESTVVLKDQNSAHQMTLDVAILQTRQMLMTLGESNSRML
jgi:hypothetical protein